MGSVMRRTSSVLTISRPGSVSSERETDNSSVSGSTRGRKDSIINTRAPLPVVTPSITESPLPEAAAAEARETVGPSPLAKPIASSEVVPPALPPPVEEIQSPIPLPVIDSTVGNPGAFTDELPQLNIAQAVAPVEPPHVEPVPLSAPEPAEPEAITTEAQVDEPISYFGGPIAESIKDFEPVDEVDNAAAEFSEAVHDENAAPEPQHHEQQNGEAAAAESYRGEVVPTTGEVVPENADVVLPEPNLGQGEEHRDDDDDVVPVAAEPERQEEPEPVPVPVPVQDDKPSHPVNVSSEREVSGGEHDDGAPESVVPVIDPSFDAPSHPVNVSSEREVRGGEHDDAVPPVIDPSSEDVRPVEETSPAPSIRCVEFIPFFRGLDPKLDLHLGWHLQTHLQTLLLPESQFLSRCSSCLSTLLGLPLHRLLIDAYRPEFADNYHAETQSHDPIVMPLPSFVDVAASKHIHHAPSESSLNLKNGSTGDLIETESAFFLRS